MADVPQVAGFHQFLLMRGTVTTDQFIQAMANQRNFQGEHESYALGFAEGPHQPGGLHARRNDHEALCAALVDMGLLTASQAQQALLDFMHDQAHYAELAMAIPSQAPQRGLMARTFEIVGELLTSEWHAQWVTESIELVEARLPLSDVNVRLQFRGGFEQSLYLSAPTTCLMRAAAHVVGETWLERELRWDLLAEFVNQVGGRAVAAMATQNVASTIDVPEKIAEGSSRAWEPIDGLAVRAGLRTGDGAIGAALTFPRT
ncbi:MAG: hypothetical protein OXU20_16025 [Myxococcales bacterium]|nr:hypothetical protein [Myxococcales bacterium]MDD9970787.1 hypothetical protein [Myxococcales bacterium]